MTLLSQLRNAKGRKILLAPSQSSHVGDNLLLERPNGGKFVDQRSMQFLERSRIFAGKKRCCRIARMFESGMNFIESGQHGTLRTPHIRITHISGMLPRPCGFNLNNGRGLCSLANRSVLGTNRRTRTASVIAQSVIYRHPSKSVLRACETAAASGAVVAVS